MTRSEPPSTSPEHVVRAFCSVWDTVDVDGILAMFAPDAVYQNGPAPPVCGKEQIATLMRKMTRGLTACDFEILHLASSGDIVFTERRDTVVVGEITAVLPVVGVFEVHDGLISEWREYFDLAMHMALLASGDSPAPGAP